MNRTEVTGANNTDLHDVLQGWWDENAQQKGQESSMTMKGGDPLAAEPLLESRTMNCGWVPAVCH
jgi:hypothetical protein